MPEFASRNPNHPEFWDERFERGFTPWNRGAVPQDLRDYVQQIQQTLPNLPVCLIPGCGHAHELGFLSEAGWQVTAIDFSPAAIATAKTQLSQWADRIVQADFFNYTPNLPLSLIYERAFFCALPPTQRPAVVARWAQLLASGGQLIGYFLLDDADNASKKGPPFRTHPGEFYALMQNDFVLVEDKEVSDSLAVFEGKERWQVWQRK